MNKRIHGTIVSITRVSPFNKVVFVNGKFCIAYAYVVKVKYSVDGKDYYKRRYLGYCDLESLPWIVTVKYSEKNPRIAQVRIPGDLDIQISNIAFAFLFLSLTLVSVGLLAIMINFHQMTKISYGELSYREFTVEEVKLEETFFGDSYNIVVSETDKTIRIDNLFSEPYLAERYLSLEKGDIIYCYLIENESYYDIVEIKSDEIILSLEEYKEIYEKNSTFGLILCPVLIVICVSSFIKALVEYLKKQKNNA